MSATNYGICALSIEGESIQANGKTIGVTAEHYNALVDEHELWYQILLENGLIEKELSEEELLSEMKEKLEKSEQALEKSAKAQEQSNKLILELIDRLDHLEKGVQNDVSKNQQLTKNDE